LAERPADLLILDLMLPGEDGLSLTRYLRQHTEMPIIILTGRGDEVDKVIGLEKGADDYVAKPFSVRELLARVKTVMRRAQSRESPAADPRQLFKFGNFEFDRMARRLINEDGTDIPLTTGEFNLLRAFTDHPNRILDRDRLSELANNRKWSPDDRSIDVLVGRLRAKIEKDPSNPELIKTVRGSGYILAAEIQS
jgi:DNA-binding response OmpR family regulator